MYRDVPTRGNDKRIKGETKGREKRAKDAIETFYMAQHLAGWLFNLSCRVRHIGELHAYQFANLRKKECLMGFRTCRCNREPKQDHALVPLEIVLSRWVSGMNIPLAKKLWIVMLKGKKGNLDNEWQEAWRRKGESRPFYGRFLLSVNMPIMTSKFKLFMGITSGDGNSIW